MADGAQKCEHGYGGNSSPITCRLSKQACICQRWCVHEHKFKHADVSHCPNYTPKVNK